MKTLILAAAAVMIAAPAFAQTATRLPLNVQLPEIASATTDPTCGGNVGLAQQATCLTTTQAAINAVVDGLSADFSRQGWIAAGGSDNRVVYVKRNEGGGCEGFQMLAFADETRVQAPGAPAWLAFATIPGDVCAAHPAPAPSNP